MSPTVKISYNLRPPAPTESPRGLQQNTTHDFPVVSQDEESSKSYYEGLQKTLAEAKEVLGKELTAWRDAVGDLEKDKDGGKSHDDEEEEEEESTENAEDSGDKSPPT